MESSNKQCAIDKLFQFYLEHQPELVKMYSGKYLVITVNSVTSFPDKVSAYRFGVDTFGPGNFLLQLCTPGDGAYTVHLHTPIFCGS